MPNDRRAILSLVALGRITPAEAERLLIAWNEGRESFWIFAACVAVALLAQLNPQQGLASLGHATRALLPVLTLHQAWLTIAHLLGGMQ
ncbi:MAG TPA: hypothetical protein VGG56_06775 [Terracidiphilus sp.]|jgi:hypothetical protein